jgi:hypothetical protein
MMHLYPHTLNKNVDTSLSSGEVIPRTRISRSTEDDNVSMMIESGEFQYGKYIQNE